MLNTLSIKNILKKHNVYSAHCIDDFISCPDQFCRQRFLICPDKYFKYYKSKLLCCYFSNRNAALYSQRRQYRFIDRFNCRTYRGISCPFNYSFTLEYICRDDFMFIGRYGNRGMARLLIAYIRIPAFIVTLAGMLLWRGVALIILNGLTLSPFPKIIYVILPALFR